jgi:hypothetical protein
MSVYFPAFDSFSPRMIDLLTAGTEILSLRASIASLFWFVLLQNICNPERKIVPVGIVSEYSPSFYPANNDGRAPGASIRDYTAC